MQMTSDMIKVVRAGMRMWRTSRQACSCRLALTQLACQRLHILVGGVCSCRQPIALGHSHQ